VSSNIHEINYQLDVVLLIHKEQVSLDMTFAMSRELTGECVISVYNRYPFAISQSAENDPKIVNNISS